MILSFVEQLYKRKFGLKWLQNLNKNLDESFHVSFFTNWIGETNSLNFS
jgi:hypothetical protein